MLVVKGNIFTVRVNHLSFGIYFKWLGKCLRMLMPNSSFSSSNFTSDIHVYIISFKELKSWSVGIKQRLIDLSFL